MSEVWWKESEYIFLGLKPLLTTMVWKGTDAQEESESLIWKLWNLNESLVSGFHN